MNTGREMKMQRRNMKIEGIKNILIDVMEKGTFLCQVRYPYCPLWPLDVKEVRKYIEDKRPSLKGRKFQIYQSNQRI